MSNNFLDFISAASDRLVMDVASPAYLSTPVAAASGGVNEAEHQFLTLGGQATLQIKDILPALATTPDGRSSGRSGPCWA